MADLVKVFALAGLDENGRDCYVVEINDDIFVLDCGTSLPDKTIPGVDYIAPNPDYLIKNKNRIKAYIITHGHDESMSGLKYFYSAAPAPVYCSKTTYFLMVGQARSKNISFHPEAIFVNPSDVIKIAGREVRFFQTCHNTVDSSGVAIYTDQGYVVYTSDFIIDFSGTDKRYYFDLKALEDLSEKEILLLMSESKTATKPGYCSPKHRVTKLIEKQFRDEDKRIFICCFWQNIFRIDEIMSLCRKYNKKVYCYNDYTRNVIKFGQEGLPAVLSGVDFVDKESLLRVREKDLVILMIGLDDDLYEEISRLGTHQNDDKRINLNEKDIFINVSLPRPTLETMCTKSMDNIYRTGCDVLWIKKDQIVSMHAREDDLKFFLTSLRPKYYLPVRGNFVNMMANAKLALSLGIGLNHNNVFIMDNGTQLVFDGKSRPQLIPNSVNKIVTDPLLVDGTGSSHLGSSVISDRIELAQDGVVVIAVTVDLAKQEIIGGPDCQMRGFVYVKEAEPLLKSISTIFVDEIKTSFLSGHFDIEKVKENTSERAKRFIKRENGREPYILPIIEVVN